jgi:hypothetical protein
LPCTIFRPPGPPPCTFLPRPFETVYDFRSPQAPPCTKNHDNRTRWECWKTKMVHGREAHGQIGQIANDSMRIRQQQRHWCRPTKSETLQKRRTNEPRLPQAHMRGPREHAQSIVQAMRGSYYCGPQLITVPQMPRSAPLPSSAAGGQGAAPCLPAALPRAWTSAGPGTVHAHRPPSDPGPSSWGFAIREGAFLCA